MTRAHFHQYAIVIAAITLIAIRQALHRRPALFELRYWRWLLSPWKLATFAISLAALAVAGPMTKDPYWDAGVTLLMSLACFATAPWAVGELARRGDRFLALVAWVWSASWSYDLYWVARRGFHPDDWLINFVISSFLYFSAGLLWNLDWSPLRGVHFSFRAPEWPRPPATGFARVALPALGVMALVGACLFLPYALIRP
jgi:hypothetical protein